MKDSGEMRTVLATLPDGLLVMSVVVNDQPLPRHFYRIVDQDGRTVSEHVALHDLAAYLQQQGRDLESARWAG